MSNNQKHQQIASIVENQKLPAQVTDALLIVVDRYRIARRLRDWRRLRLGNYFRGKLLTLYDADGTPIMRFGPVRQRRRSNFVKLNSVRNLIRRVYLVQNGTERNISPGRTLIIGP